ncbi:MAG: DUF5723 family protein [Chitinophagaceae bacterium]
MRRPFSFLSPWIFYGCVLLPGWAKAQEFSGYANSNRAGIYGIMDNPASAASSPYGYDINILGADIRVGNSYLSLTRKNLFSGHDTLYLNQNIFADTNSTKPQFGWEQTDILGPSFLLSLPQGQGVAFSMRLRTQVNIDHLNTPTANFLLQGLRGNSLNKNVFEGYSEGNFHAWDEYDFTYARVLSDNGTDRWKGGITLKILSGQASGYFAAQNVNYTLPDSSNRINLNSGQLLFGYAGSMNSWTTNPVQNFHPFQNLGVGMDIGLMYEWRPDANEDIPESSRDIQNSGSQRIGPYKLRIGFSITDLGGIRYKNASSARNLTLSHQSLPLDSLQIFAGESFVAFNNRINSYFQQTDRKDFYTMALPTSIHLNADYAYTKEIYFNFNALISLTGGKTGVSKTHYISTFSLTPRWESKWTGLYLPISINTLSQSDLGMAIRLGPLLIGSSSLISNLFRHSINHADGFIALRILPFFSDLRKSKMEKKYLKAVNCAR